MDFNQPLGGNEMPRFAGPGTMMRLPAKGTAEGLDACFVGVPFDLGTSHRSGGTLWATCDTCRIDHDQTLQHVDAHIAVRFVTNLPILAMSPWREMIETNDRIL